MNQTPRVKQIEKGVPAFDFRIVIDIQAVSFIDAVTHLRSHITGLKYDKPTQISGGKVKMKSWEVKKLIKQHLAVGKTIEQVARLAGLTEQQVQELIKDED